MFRVHKCMYIFMEYYIYTYRRIYQVLYFLLAGSAGESAGAGAADQGGLLLESFLNDAYAGSQNSGKITISL